MEEGDLVYLTEEQAEPRVRLSLGGRIQADLQCLYQPPGRWIANNRFEARPVEVEMAVGTGKDGRGKEYLTS